MAVENRFAHDRWEKARRGLRRHRQRDRHGPGLGLDRRFLSLGAGVVRRPVSDPGRPAAALSDCAHRAVRRRMASDPLRGRRGHRPRHRAFLVPVGHHGQLPAAPRPGPDRGRANYGMASWRTQRLSRPSWPATPPGWPRRTTSTPCRSTRTAARCSARRPMPPTRCRTRSSSPRPSSTPFAIRASCVAWLYAVARNECLRRAASRERLVRLSRPRTPAGAAGGSTPRRVRQRREPVLGARAAHPAARRERAGALGLDA